VLFLIRLEGSVSKVEMVTPMALIYKVLFPSISTFETPPTRGFRLSGNTRPVPLATLRRGRFP
jgi:hypothetical protein